MIIPINERYRLTSDEHQWIIQKKRYRNERECWESRLYYPNLNAAVKGLGEMMVRQSKADTLAPIALEAVENVATTLCQALTPQIEGLGLSEKADTGQ